MTINFQEYVENKRRKPDEDSKYMEIALKAANAARSNGDRAVGAVLTYPGGHMVDYDTSYSSMDRTCHAEMNVIRKVAKLRPQGLSDCVLFSTVEPCPMCLHAASLSGIREVVFGAYDTKNGFISSKKLTEVHEGIAIKGGVLAEDCIKVNQKLLQEHLKTENQHAE
jgi:tRNA(adenine34) deaminase